MTTHPELADLVDPLRLDDRLTVYADSATKLFRANYNMLVVTLRDREEGQAEPAVAYLIAGR